MTAPFLHDLTDLQWELDGLVMGPGTAINVRHVDFGGPDALTNDAANPRMDGERHGREYRSGRTLTFELNALSSGIDVLDVLATVEAAWDAEDGRATPGRYSLLRYRKGTRTRRVWGSPRDIAADSTMDWVGNVPITSTFRTVDHRFYDDAESSNGVSINPVPSGGLLAPLQEPLSTLAVSNAPGVVTIGGNVRTWIYFQLTGPITNPRIECLGEWAFQLNIVLLTGQTVVIDPRPWSRGIRLNNQIPVGGQLTQDSPRLSDLRLSPGVHEIVLTGSDVTMTAQMLMAWRNAYSSY